jgi:hypothetical protein
MFQQNNTKLLFDLTLRKAIPYLISSPPEFREKLAEQMDRLFHFLQGGDSSITTFNECNEGILEMLNEARGTFNWTITQNINSLANIYSTYDERISRIDERITNIEKGKKSGKRLRDQPIKDDADFLEIKEKVELLSLGLMKVNAYQMPVPNEANTELLEIKQRVEHLAEEVKKLSDAAINPPALPDNTQLIPDPPSKSEEPKVVEPKVVEGPVTDISSLRSTKRKRGRASKAPCPSCGRAMQKKKENYYCFKSKQGCGKIFIQQHDGVLLEKIFIKPLYMYECECGMKLSRSGKIDLNGESVQRYCCKNGCGTYYVQDKEGDLHKGFGKVALDKPKSILKKD